MVPVFGLGFNIGGALDRTIGSDYYIEDGGDWLDWGVDTSVSVLSTYYAYQALSALGIYGDDTIGQAMTKLKMEEL